MPRARWIQCFKYYLVLDEGDIDVKLAPWEADDKISQLKAMVEEYDRLKTPALMRQAEQIVEIEKKRDAQSQDSTLPQEEMKPKKKRKIPFTDWLEKRDATEARQTNR
jgi:hypothetical protein